MNMNNGNYLFIFAIKHWKMELFFLLEMNTELVHMLWISEKGYSSLLIQELLRLKPFYANTCFVGGSESDVTLDIITSLSLLVANVTLVNMKAMRNLNKFMKYNSKYELNFSKLLTWLCHM